LTDTDQAIVTDIAGTTTDYISATATFDQLSIELIDTAGFETATGEISVSAQVHRDQQESAADLRVLCIDAAIMKFVGTNSNTVFFNDPDSADAKWTQQKIQNLSDHDLVVLNKIELLTGHLLPENLMLTSELRLDIGEPENGHPPEPVHVIMTSSKTGEGLDALRNHIQAALRGDAGDSVVGSTVQRASESLTEAAESLTAAISATEHQLGDEIVAAEIREALNALGQVVGTVYTDDILDLVFGRFCIGK